MLVLTKDCQTVETQEALVFAVGKDIRTDPTCYYKGPYHCLFWPILLSTHLPQLDSA